jgi:hypothetical protein
MSRAARLAMLASLALAAAGLAALPAQAQGTVREHRGGPPAPTPTEDRDQRRGARENDPVQWEVRGSVVKPCINFQISNLRREGLGRDSILTPNGGGLGWVERNGGDWMLAVEKKDITWPCTMAGNVGPEVLLSLYNKGNNRFLSYKLGWDDELHRMWHVKRVKTVKRDGLTYSRFAIYNTGYKRFLMLCHDEADRAKNNDKLCLYNADQERPER